MAAPCTVVVSAAGAKCGEPAIHAFPSRDGREVFAECAKHGHPIPVRRVMAEPAEVGRKAEIHWHSWAKRGEVVAVAGSRIVVRFVPRKGAAPIERAFSREAVKFV